jgi:hypothetical protein
MYMSVPPVCQLLEMCWVVVVEKLATAARLAL